MRTAFMSQNVVQKRNGPFTTHTIFGNPCLRQNFLSQPNVFPQVLLLFSKLKPNYIRYIWSPDLAYAILWAISDGMRRKTEE